MIEKRATLGWGFWLALAAGLGWSLYRALLNESWILDDEISHFLFSWKVLNGDSGMLWDTWTRPGRNLIHFIPSYFGIEVARMWTLFLAGVTVWLVGREADSLGLKLLWVLPLLICFQWWFPMLSYAVLTQTPFMIVWFLGVYLARRKQLVWAALCWGYLPLVRHEGIALSGLWGLWVICGPDGFVRKMILGKWDEFGGKFLNALWLGFWTFLPLIVMNVMTWMSGRGWPFLIWFESKPTEMYGSGSIFLYLGHLLWGAGLPVVAFLVWGMFRKWKVSDWALVLYWTYPAYLVMQSLIYWKGLFASGGYYHFIMPMAPWIGLVALKGVEALNDLAGKFSKWVMGLVAAGTVYGGLIMYQFQWQIPDGHIPGLPEKFADISWVAAPPLRQSRFGGGLEKAADWVRNNVKDEQWLSHHISLEYYLYRESYGEKLGGWGGYSVDSDQFKPGAILIWDVNYSVGTHGFTLEALEKNGWEEVEQFAWGSVRVFRKP